MLWPIPSLLQLPNSVIVVPKQPNTITNKQAFYVLIKCLLTKSGGRPDVEHRLYTISWPQVWVVYHMASFAWHACHDFWEYEAILLARYLVAILYACVLLGKKESLWKPVLFQSMDLQTSELKQQLYILWYTSKLVPVTHIVLPFFFHRNYFFKIFAFLCNLSLV